MKPNFRIEMADGFYLSRIVRTDKAAYLEHFADPEIARNTLAIPFPYTEADADWWLDQCEKQASEPEKVFAIRERGGSLVGAIGIDGVLPAESHEAEFGYWLAKPYRGRGLMVHAIRVFADHAFQKLGLHRIYATPFVHNIASQRVLEKARFQREGLHRRHHLKNGVYLDAVVYERFAESDVGAVER
jgi:RimJ/RimL family protein N-acetyltransferase